MAVPERVLRHLVRHGYLRQDLHAAPLAMLLLTNVQKLWLAEWRSLLRVPLVPMVPGTLGGLRADLSTDLPSRDRALCDHLDTVASSFGVTPPYAASLSTLPCFWHDAFLGPQQCSWQSSGSGDISEPLGNSAGQTGEKEAAASSSGTETRTTGVFPFPRPDLSICARVPKSAAEKWLRVFQRQRRIWWRQLLRDPGDISLVQQQQQQQEQLQQVTESRSAVSTEGATSVVFRGQLCVERLYVRDEGGASDSDARAPMSLLYSHMARDCCLWTLAADSLYEQEHENSSPLHISQRLAPYTHAVIGSGTQTGALFKLASYISNKWSQSGVSVFPGSPVFRPPPSMTRALQVVDPAEIDRVVSGGDCARDGSSGGDSSASGAGNAWLDSALLRLDAVGVSVTVLLDDTSLTSGVCRVRYRDTALTFESHVAHVVNLTAFRMGASTEDQEQDQTSSSQ